MNNNIDEILASRPSLNQHGERLESTELFSCLIAKWESRIKDTPRRSKSGGVDYVGGLIDAYQNCLIELNEILEENDRDQTPPPEK